MYVSVSVSLLLTFHFLPPVHVVCEKVILLVVSVSQSVRLSTGVPMWPLPMMSWDITPPHPHPNHHMNLLKCVHLEPPPTTWTCSNLFTWALLSHYHMGTPPFTLGFSPLTERHSCFLFRVVVTWVGGLNVSYYAQEKTFKRFGWKSFFLKGFQSKFLLSALSIVRSKKRKKIDDWWMATSTLFFSQLIFVDVLNYLLKQNVCRKITNYAELEGLVHLKDKRLVELWVRWDLL